MTITSSKINYGVATGPDRLAIAKINYGVVVGLDGLTITKMTYGIVLDTNATAARRRQIINS